MHSYSSPIRLLRSFVLVLLLTLLVGCAQPCQPAAEPVSPSQMSPEEVNTAWLDALEQKDRDAALAVYDPLGAFRAGQVQTSIDNFPRLEPTPYKSWIKLERLPVVTDGAQYSGILALTYRDAGRAFIEVDCYGTTIGKVAGEWKVLRWDYARCPDEVVPDWQLEERRKQQAIDP